MAGFNLTALEQQLVADAQAHFSTQMLGADETEENIFIVREFLQKAQDLMRQDGKINLPDMPMPIVYDDKTASQVLSLFHHGIVLVLDKCAALQIVENPKQYICQMAALEVFKQANQIAASTYGQEQTPQFQIPEEKQQAWIRQASENHFIHFLTEYERQNGPIVKHEEDALFEENMGPQQVSNSPQLPASGEEDDWFNDVDDSLLDEENDDWMSDLKTPPPVEQQNMPQSGPPVAAQYNPTPIQPEVPKPAFGKDLPKYAAVALLLGTLTPTLQQRVLSHFDVNQRKVIDSYWQEPNRIERETDMQEVEYHLKRFKALIEQGGQSLHSNAQRQIQHLVQAYSRADVLSCSERERPRIQQYLAGFYTDRTALMSAEENEVQLPGKIEEILYHHLHKALSYR